MKSRFSLLKKVRTGMTLLELVIAMALVSIVLAGAGTALFAMQSTANRETKNHITLFEAKTLSQAIDHVVKGRNGQTVVFNHGKDIGKNEVRHFFTLGDDEVYGFDGKVFGKVEGGAIQGDDVIYTASNPMYITCDNDNAPFEEIVIHYGDKFAYSLTLIEKV